MVNPVTNRVPSDVDSFLQDMAQTEDLFGYHEIWKFGKHATVDDIKTIRELEHKYIDARDCNDPSEIGILKEIQYCVLKYIEMQ